MTVHVAETPDSAHRTYRRRLRPGKDRIPATVAVLAVVGGIAGYARADRRMWFFGDDWSFLLRRPLTHDTLHNLLTPHNEHWSTIPILIFRGLYATVGLRHYLAYQLPVLAAHAGVCALLWILMRRAGATSWAAAGGVILMAICGGGVENLIWDFQIGFVGSVFFGLLATVVVDTDEVRLGRRILAWGLACCALMCSGIGLPMIVGLVAFTAFRHGKFEAIRIGSVPAIVYLVWYETYGHVGTAGDGTSTHARLQSPKYFWTGMTNVWQVNTGIPNSGTLLLLLLVGPLLCLGVRDRLGRLALSLLCSAVSLFGLTSLTRVRFGLDQANASRYVYVATALTIPAAVWGASRLVAAIRVHRPDNLGTAVATVAILIALTVVNMVSVADAFYRGRMTTVVSGKRLILAAAQVVRDHPVLYYQYPDRHFSPEVTTTILASPGVQAALPRLDASESDLLEARGRLQVSVSLNALDLPPASAVVFGDRPLAMAPSSCASAAGTAGETITASVGAKGGRIWLAGAGSAVYTSLHSGGSTSPAIGWSTAAGQTEDVATSAANVELLIRLRTTGLIAVCLP